MKRYEVVEVSRHVKFVDGNLHVGQDSFEGVGPGILDVFKNLTGNDVAALVALLKLPGNEGEEVKALSEEI